MKTTELREELLGTKISAYKGDLTLGEVFDLIPGEVQEEVKTLAPDFVVKMFSKNREMPIGEVYLHAMKRAKERGASQTVKTRMSEASVFDFCLAPLISLPNLIGLTAGASDELKKYANV